MQGEAYFMDQIWSLYYGEFIALGIWGVVLALTRRILFGKLCREAALGNGGKGKMLKAMTLKFEKSYEVRVGIHDMKVFVKKYLCQEKKFGIRLGKWKQLPERWTSIVLGIGFVEAMVLRYLRYDGLFCLNRFLAAATAAVTVRVVSLWFESDSLWEQAQVYLLDYVSNTLYPRQMHVYEGFGEDEKEVIRGDTGIPEEKEANPTAKGASGGVVLNQEEEQIFQEVLSDFLGSST